MSGVHFVAYDGNGNVAGLVKAADGTLTGRYEYGPFGEVIRATGLIAKFNPFRFSTKFQDDETDLLYYRYRYYNASTARWISRDPAGEEEGGPNLYGFLANDGVNSIDDLGLWDINRYYQEKAGARAKPGNTIMGLANRIGLRTGEYRDWLTADSGTAMPASWAQPLNGCEHFKIPNTVVAYWGGVGADYGKDWVQWYRSVIYLGMLGFHVDVRDHVIGDDLGLAKIFHEKSSAKELHGLYFWGEGIYNRATKQYIGLASRPKPRDALVYRKYPGLEYGMALGLVFACGSNSGEIALMSLNPGQIWHGYTGILNPVNPFQRFSVNHHIHRGNQGTRR